MKKMILKSSLFMILCSASIFSFAATCTSAIQNNAVGSLTVPANAVCTLNGTAVEGNIVVQKNASLVLNNSSVNGSLQADTAKSVKLMNSSVEGDVRATQVSTILSLDQSSIEGNVYCSSLAKLQANMSSITGKIVGQCKK